MADFDSFMQDHAAAEKKAAGMAISMLSHYPDRLELVAAMADLAVEEMTHFREVVKWLHRRGLQTVADRKDAYVLALMDTIRKGRDVYLLDRLLTASVIEARGAERFGLVAGALDDAPLKRFYRSIARSEERHFEQFLTLAQRYFPVETVTSRWQTLLDLEAEIVTRLPVRSALH
jgi:tRNA-(ms[2]io[6]A)-hydroxylase